MASTDPDELYTLRNLFWLGSFQQAINEGGRLNRLSDELKVERDEFVYRSYVGQGQYALVISEVDDDAPPNLRAVKLLAEYLENPKGRGRRRRDALGTWLTEKETRENSGTTRSRHHLSERRPPEGGLHGPQKAVNHGTSRAWRTGVPCRAPARNCHLIRSVSS